MKIFFIAGLLLFLFCFSGCISPPVCGNGICEIGESAQTCPQDCGTRQLCKDLGGAICKPSEDCNGQTVPASDGDCCLGDCTPKSCYDSDGGLNYDVNGYVEFLDEELNLTQKYDHCNSPNLLIEYYCSNGEAKEEEHLCISGTGGEAYCQNGKCVEAIFCPAGGVTGLNLPSAPVAFSVNISEFSVPTILQKNAVSVNRQFSNNGEFDVSRVGSLAGLSADIDVSLLKSTGFARAVLVDALGREYLIFGTDNIVFQKGDFSFGDFCAETCLLNNVSPQKIRFEAKDATIFVRALNPALYSANVGKYSAATAEILTRQQSAKMLGLTMQNNARKGAGWIAGKTSVSRLSFMEKKRLFGGKLPNLFGFEFYKGGVFELPSEQSASRVPTATVAEEPAYLLPESFDWRNAHGQNWITPIKNQGGCGSCWAFAAVGSIEGAINAYYNQHLDLNLSEQQIVSCSQAGNCGGGFPMGALAYIKNTGIADEECFLYTSTDENCNQMCTDYQNRVWKITDSNFLDEAHSTEYYVKKALIEKGPLAGSIGVWSHAMAVVGYDFNSESGRTLIIYKNSWGPDWGENGFVKLYARLWIDMFFDYLETPIIPPLDQILQIACEDNDGDEYCNWGISPGKPASCPQSCNELRDIDDSNSEVHALETFNNVCGDTILAGLEKCEAQTAGAFPSTNNKYCPRQPTGCYYAAYSYYEDGMEFGTCNSNCSCEPATLLQSQCKEHCSCPNGTEPYCLNCGHCYDSILNCGEQSIDDCIPPKP